MFSNPNPNNNNNLFSYCTCGWSGQDDVNDTNFNHHIWGDLSNKHRMCSVGEWHLCKESSHKDHIIKKLEAQLEENCSEEVVILREKILNLEKQIEILKEKLYTNTNEREDRQQRTSAYNHSRLNRRRKSAN